jgi:hypothetical protein
MSRTDFRFDFLKVKSKEQFDELALKTFFYQVEEVEIYSKYVQQIGIDISAIKHADEIPFLPISFFKSHQIVAKEEKSVLSFSSSGTTGTVPSKHFIVDTTLYERSFNQCFQLFYGDPQQYCILALLPSYLERNNSSLVYMVDSLIKKSAFIESGFYLNDYQSLYNQLTVMHNREIPVILFGVTFALLEFVKLFPGDFSNLTVIETGGMKGRGKELIREDLHNILRDGFGVKTIHSEYGMTELLTQAYSKEAGIFDCPPWMKIVIRDMNDPLTTIGTNQFGAVNVIDLANYFSCSFIATQDLGRIDDEGKFEITGRFDESEMRGCNLMMIER